MANRGETIENPLTGERMTFLKTSGDTNGQAFEFEFVAPPGWSVPEHIHPHQQERTQVISGVLSGRVAGEEAGLVAGEVRVVPSGVVHAWRNPSDQEEARFSVEFRPALNMESGFETAYGLARDGKATKAGMPKNPLQLAVLASEHKDEVYLTRPPIPVQKALVGALTLLAPVGRALGYKARYPKYSGPDPSEGDATRAGRHRAVGLATVGLVLAVALVHRRSLRR